MAAWTEKSEEFQRDVIGTLASDTRSGTLVCPHPALPAMEELLCCCRAADKNLHLFILFNCASDLFIFITARSCILRVG